MEQEFNPSVNWKFRKKKPGKTKMTSEVEKLCTKEAWDKHGEKILQMQDEWVNVARLFILMGKSIEGAIYLLDRVLNITCKWRLQPHEIVEIWVDCKYFDLFE